MAGLGFKDFQVGEVLTSADVDGYLMQQTVMRFADSAARGSALGTAVGTGVPLAEGMVSYLDDTNTVQVYSGAAWVGIGNFTAGTAITVTDASWPVPALADPVVRVTVIGGGGGGGAAETNSGSTGSTTTFGVGETWAVSATGGTGGRPNNSLAGRAGEVGFVSSNGGEQGGGSTATRGFGGQVVVGYVDLTGVSTVNVTIGAGGAGGVAGTYAGGAGGRGVVIVEYRAG